MSAFVTRYGFNPQGLFADYHAQLDSFPLVTACCAQPGTVAELVATLALHPGLGMRLVAT